MSILSILFWIAVAFWTIWFVGYPIYIKVKKKKILTFHYILGLNIGAIVINILNIINLIARTMH